MVTKLEDLAGPPLGEDPRDVVIRHFNTIRDARARGWRWRPIAEALGLTELAVKRAFSRVDRQVRLGRIDLDALRTAQSSKHDGDKQ